eukprot:15479248-Alexandrium_andersonii.AAC.1
MPWHWGHFHGLWSALELPLANRGLAVVRLGPLPGPALQVRLGSCEQVRYGSRNAHHWCLPEVLVARGFAVAGWVLRVTP